MWSQAVITEVYTLQGFLIALIIYLVMQPDPDSVRTRKYLDSWRGLVLGLSMGNHITTILLVPAALLVGSIYKQSYGHGDVQNRRGWFGNWRCDGLVLRRRLSWFGAGLLIYVVLPLRAMAHPPVNWGNPITLRNLWWLVSGQLYKSYYLNISLSGIWEHLQVAAELLLAQFGEIGTMLGLLGLIVFSTRSRLYVLTTWAAASSLAFAVIYGSVDFYNYLIPMILAFAIWIGLGIAGLTHKLSNRHPVFGLGLILLICGYLAVRTLSFLSQVDASDDRRAESFGHEVLATAPQNAIIFAKGDQAVFTLWYYHFALGERPDLTVLAEDLLHFDWYQENLHMIYPSIVISGPFPYPETIIRANPTNAVCNVHYLESPEGLCSKPLDFP